MNSRITPYEWFSTFLDNLSNEVEHLVNMTEEKNNFINQCKSKLDKNMQWVDLSQFEDEIYSIVKMLTDKKAISLISQAYNTRGIAYYRHVDEDKAIKEFTKAIELDPTNTVFYHNRAWAYKSAWKPDHAMQDYSKIIELDPTDIAAYYYRGKNTRSNIKSSIEDFKNVILIDPKTALDYSYRGLSLGELGELDKSIDEHNKAIALKPNFAILYINRANTNIKSGNVPIIDVLIDCCMAFHIDPGMKSKVNLLLFDLFFNRTNPELLFREIKAIKNQELQIFLLNDLLNDQSPLGIWFKNNLSFFDGILPKSLKREVQNYYNELLKKIPEGTNDIKSIITQYYLEKGNTKKTKTVDEEALDHIRLGKELLFSSGSRYSVIADSIILFTRAIKLIPECEDAYYHRGVALLRRGHEVDKEMAIADLIKVTELNPKNKKAYYLLGLYYCDTPYYWQDDYWRPSKYHHIEIAMTAHTKAIEADPTYVDAYLERAVLYVIKTKLDSSNCKEWMAKAMVDCMMADHLKPNDKNIKSQINKLFTFGLKQFNDNKLDMLEVIKEISDMELQIKVLNYALYEKSPLAELIKPSFFSSDDIISRIRVYRNELVAERNDVKNAAIGLGQAHRQNMNSRALLPLGWKIDQSQENKFYPLAVETLKKIGFFSSMGPFQKTFDKYFEMSFPKPSSSIPKILPPPPKDENNPSGATLKPNRK